MPSNRSNLTLDEQAFQGLLSAAFTIQEHNDRRRQAQQTPAEPEAHLEPDANRACPHCGAPKPADASRCQSCGLDELRPGERLQRNWASMWLMSQEQGLWPDRSAEIREGAQKDVPPLEPERSPRAQSARHCADDGFLALPIEKREIAKQTIAQEKTGTIHHRALGESALDQAEAESAAITAATEDSEPEDSDLDIHPYQLSSSGDSFPTEAEVDAGTEASIDATAVGTSWLQRLADLRVTLRFHRADLYLGAAICVATLALLWPAAGTPRHAALGPFDRALISLGIAEAPAPVVHLQGDPGIQVWVDPHTALFYCPGEEQYGKTADGRFSTQRDAQMDRFEPAGRAPCE